MIIKKRELFWVCILLPYLVPELVYMNSITGRLTSALKILNILIIAILYVKNKTIRINWILIWITAYQFTAFISGMRYGIFSMESLLTIGVCLIFHCGISCDTDSFWKALLWICELFIIINFVTMVIFPGGMYSKHSNYQRGSYELNWFLGYKNTIVRFILPSILFELLDYYRKEANGKLIGNKDIARKAVVIFMGTISLFFSSSINGILGIIVFLLLAYLTLNVRRRFTLSPVCAFFFFGTVSCGIIGFNMQYYFSFIIGIILKKNVTTMSGRNIVWLKAQELIRENFLLGWGDYGSKLLYTVGASHPHNLYLHILLKSGLVGLALFLIMLFSISKKLNTSKETYFSGLISACLACFFMMGIMESLTGAVLLYPCFLISAYNNYLFSDVCLENSRGDLR